MRSKARQTFDTKVKYFLDDIELIDVFRTAVLENDLTDTNSKYVLARIDLQRHRHLQRRANTDGSRTLAINHLRSTVYGSFVKDVYEEVTHYLKTIVKQAARSGFDAGRIIGEHSFTTDAQALLRLGNWEAVCEHVAESVFRALENERSTVRLLSKMSKKLGLEVPSHLIDELAPYLQVRHFLVHLDGHVDKDFRSTNTSFRFTKKGKVVVNYRFVTELTEKSQGLIEAFDTAVIANKLLADEFIQR